MSDPHPWDTPQHMDFEEPEAPVSTKTRKKREKTPGTEMLPIPRLPKPEPALTGDEVRRGVSDQARAAANLKVDGFTYQEIADMLEYPDARTAKRAVERVLAATHSVEDYETLRVIATARAESLWRRSSAMASADYLLLDDDSRVPNVDKLRWHQQASVDLMNYAVITGAKAPTKHEITPGEGAFDVLVDRILELSGHEDIIEAEVIDLEYIPEPPADEIEGDG